MLKFIRRALGIDRRIFFSGAIDVAWARYYTRGGRFLFSRKLL